jgi:phosphatidylserine decarboxylase
VSNALARSVRPAASLSGLTAGERPVTRSARPGRNIPFVRIDRAAWPFVTVAVLPAAVSAIWAPTWLVLALLVLPVGVALFFRDPERLIPVEPGLVVAPADGRVMHAGDARPAEAPPGEWRQITIFLSVLDVHINRSPVGAHVTKVTYVPGSFLPAYRRESYANEHSEIWLDAGGTPVVVRQVVGRGARIGLMKFGSRMDVFVPTSAVVATTPGARVSAGETIIARLSGEAP